MSRKEREREKKGEEKQRVGKENEREREKGERMRVKAKNVYEWKVKNAHRILRANNVLDQDKIS